MTWKGVFFDLFGTLLVYGDMPNAWADWLTALHRSLVESGHDVTEAALAAQCVGFTDKPPPPSANDGLTTWERRMRAIFLGLGLQLEHEEISEAVYASTEVWQAHISVDPDAHSVLRALKPAQTLGLITNFEHPPHVYAVLEDSGLLGLFDVVVISGEIGLEKPDPRIFHLALAETSLAPHEVIYVGDSVQDMEGSHAAGLHPVLIQRDQEAVSGVVDPSEPDEHALERGAQQASADCPTMISRLRELTSLVQSGIQSEA